MTDRKERKVNIYCDMDGVLADFMGADGAIERFENERGFFQTLKPIKNNVATIKSLIADGNVNVFILSASPNDQADRDKKVWLKVWLPEIADGNIIIMRNGERKANYIKTDGINILFDDYGRNCREWLGVSYKVDRWHSIKRGLKVLL